VKPSGDTVSKLITNRLLGRIIEGFYPAGGKLPTEREIAEEFKVTRNVVREALKRLEALGLVTIRQGSGIYVEDLRLSGGVELLELLIRKSDGSINLDMLRDIIEFYEDVITSVVKLAALRITDDELARFKALVGAVPQSMDDHKKLAQTYQEIVALFVGATHNTFYQLLYNTMVRIRILSVGFTAALLSLTPSLKTYFERLEEAFRRNDSEMAGLLTTRIFESFEENAPGMLRQLQEMDLSTAPQQDEAFRNPLET
jgi:DNA-binding FadR family transcriptional regulator